MLKITLDTNCIINRFDTDSPSRTSVDALETLFKLHETSQLELAITTRVETDLSRDKDTCRSARILSLCSSLPTIGAVAQWDISKWNRDIWGSEEWGKLRQRVQEILWPNLSTSDGRYENKREDISHIVAHHIHNRNCFVTDETAILRKSEAVAKIEIQVMCPQKCVDTLNNISISE